MQCDFFTLMVGYTESEFALFVFTVYTSRTTNEQKPGCIGGPAASVSGGSFWETC